MRKGERYTRNCVTIVKWSRSYWNSHIYKSIRFNSIQFNSIPFNFVVENDLNELNSFGCACVLIYLCITCVRRLRLTSDGLVALQAPNLADSQNNLDHDHLLIQPVVKYQTPFLCLSTRFSCTSWKWIEHNWFFRPTQATIEIEK